MRAKKLKNQKTKLIHVAILELSGLGKRNL